ncbi:MAG: hypothetical protein EBQ89_03485 [Alphaproteobacteria bacterium]|nr:hypothetical protein [Alphaproteobacteria bacterium]
MREAQLGIAVGKRGIGKTFTTLQIIEQYVLGYSGHSIPRRVLIMDVNDEFQNIKGLKLSDVKLFSVHPTIEARRIRPFNPNGSKMSLEDVCQALYFILENFRGGLLLIEDINKYLTHHFPKDVVGAICTNRHADMDIIMHYQAIGKVPTTVWENANWIRFHKNNQSVDRHEKKFEDKYEMLKIAESLVEFQYNNGNERFFCYCDIDMGKIKGRITEQMAIKGIEDYMIKKYSKVVTPETRRVNLDGNKVHKTIADASLSVKKHLLHKYFSKNL